MAEMPMTHAGASAVREFVIALPAGLPVLNLNQRLHWTVRNRRTQILKQAAWAMALQAKLPRLQRATVTVEYQPPDRRRRDADNLAASGKPLIDGLVAAKVLPEDNSEHVPAVRYTIGPVHPGGRFVLHVRELDTGGAA